ncbi:MAG: DEAD/DEAH box helicase, partial [Clostridia bacterium]
LKYAPSERQTVMFSATVPSPIKAIMREYMRSPEYIEIGQENSTIDEIEQTYIRISGIEKRYAIVELFRRLIPKRAIIFCNTKRMVDMLLPIMNESGFHTLALHGDMAQPERKRVMGALKNHKAQYLIATDVAARGIDIEDVEYIFNFDMPADMEYYIHRIGRTGRAGKSGKAISFIGNQDELILLSDIMTATRSSITEHEMAESIEKYAEMMMRERPRGFSSPRDKNRPRNPRPNKSYPPRRKKQ